MSALVEVSMNFDGFEESMFKKPIYTDENHADLAFHRFALLRQNKHLTDAVIVSSDDKRCGQRLQSHRQFVIIVL